MDFDTAFERLLGHEGGLVDHPADPGGLTKYGISQRSFPGEDIRGMTITRARQIYKTNYWGPAGCDAVPEAIRFDLFDAAVNSGVRQAIKWLQHAVGAYEDGILGGKTLQAVQSMSPDRILMRFNASRLLFMTGLSTWTRFGKGWARRIAENILTA